MLLFSLALLGSVVITARAVTVYGQMPLAQTIGADPTNTAIVAVETPDPFQARTGPTSHP